MHSIKYVIGLGNPEKKYDPTPHNIGRGFVTWLADRKKSGWRGSKRFELAEIPDFPTLVRLDTYMNLSGEAVRELLYKFSSQPSDILVCTDDFDLPMGTIRVRKKGSAGTHNGLKSIIQQLGTPEFPRLRMGVGPLPAGGDAAQYVLASFPKALQSKILPVYELTALAVQAAFERGLDASMNEFNAKTIA